MRLNEVVTLAISSLPDTTSEGTSFSPLLMRSPLETILSGTTRTMGMWIGIWESRYRLIGRSQKTRHRGGHALPIFGLMLDLFPASTAE
jgi:hypothetical protein